MAAGNATLEEASRLADESVTITETAIRKGGRGADFLPIALLRRSAIRFKSARYIESAEDAERVVTLLQNAQAPGTFSSYLGRAYYALGKALKSQGKSSEAQVAFQEAAQQLQKTLGPDNPETRRVWRQTEVTARRRQSVPSA